MKRLALASLTMACSLACAPVARSVAAPDDYAAYRSYRLAGRLGEKLSAAQGYLSRHPRGAFRDEVEAWFRPVEERFFEEAGHTEGGASAYLHFLPHGPHADAATAFLRALAGDRRVEPERTGRRLDEARLRAINARRSVGRSVQRWLGLALAVQSWQRDQEDFLRAEKAFRYAFFGPSPYPECDDEGCVRSEVHVYPVPDADPARDRHVVIRTRLHMTAGVVTGFSIVLPRMGFIAMLEGNDNQPVEELVDDEVVLLPSRRREAIAFARGFVDTLVIARAPGPCSWEEPENKRVVTCAHVRVAVGTTPAGEDAIVLSGLR